MVKEIAKEDDVSGAIPIALLIEIGIVVLKYCLVKRTAEQVVGELRNLKPRHKLMLRRATIEKHGRAYWKLHGEQLWRQAQDYLRNSSDTTIRNAIKQASKGAPSELK